MSILNYKYIVYDTCCWFVLLLFSFFFIYIQTIICIFWPIVSFFFDQNKDFRLRRMDPIPRILLSLKNPRRDPQTEGSGKFGLKAAAWRQCWRIC